MGPLVRMKEGGMRFGGLRLGREECEIGWRGRGS